MKCCVNDYIRVIVYIYFDRDRSGTFIGHLIFLSQRSWFPFNFSNNLDKWI